MRTLLLYVISVGCVIMMLGCASGAKQENAKPAGVSNLSDTESQIQSIENRLKTTYDNIRQIEYKINRYQFKSVDDYGREIRDLEEKKSRLEDEYNYLVRELSYLKKKALNEKQ